MKHTESAENYLKTIWDLETGHGRATTSEIARRLAVAPASATGMVKRLSGLGLLDHTPYRGVTLTETGRRTALRVVRRHRLIESFLVRIMDVPRDRVHEEAERWEHVLSEDMEDRIDQLLGHPDRDPHGSPIPARDTASSPAPEEPS
ncbi:MAG: metal-dependent transcriptional regulator [bacterium]|nr:metal-dependent transcriptional regulator [bacterium]